MYGLLYISEYVCLIGLHSSAQALHASVQLHQQLMQMSNPLFGPASSYASVVPAPPPPPPPPPMALQQPQTLAQPLLTSSVSSTLAPPPLPPPPPAHSNVPSLSSGSGAAHPLQFTSFLLGRRYMTSSAAAPHNAAAPPTMQSAGASTSGSATLISAQAASLPAAAAATPAVDTRPHSLHTMFRARVLTGRSCRGQTSYKKPPPMLGDASGRLYDSCVDNDHAPHLYVVFDHSQSYPEYIIEYKCYAD